MQIDRSDASYVVGVDSRDLFVGFCSPAVIDWPVSLSVMLVGYWSGDAVH